jgi:hypothetical protein
VLDCQGKKHTYQQIAIAYGVHVSAVSQAMRKHGLAKAGSRVDHVDTLPWTLHADHRHQTQASMLRMLSRLRAGDEAIPAEKLRRLRRWLQRLEDAGEVITYSRELGWSSTPAHPGDAPFVRLPDYADGEAYDDPVEREIWQTNPQLSADQRRDLIAEIRSSHQSLERWSQERIDQATELYTQMIHKDDRKHLSG